MRRVLLSTFAIALSTLLVAPSADAHSWYGWGLKEKYGFQSVSCYTCHLSHSKARASMTDEQFDIYQAKSRRYLNEFGKAIVPVLPESDVAKEIDLLYLLRRRTWSGGRDDGMQKLKEQGKSEFLAILPQVEVMRDPTTGKTYGQLLKSGELEGVKRSEEPRPMRSDR